MKHLLNILGFIVSMALGFLSISLVFYALQTQDIQFIKEDAAIVIELETLGYGFLGHRTY